MDHSLICLNFNKHQSIIGTKRSLFIQYIDQVFSDDTF